MKIDDLKGLCIAHRGIHNDIVIENTIPAFSLALEKNIPIELDIHILKDENIVVYHDNNLKRLIGVDKNISSYSYDELKKTTFPNTEIHIPLFKDVLDFINGKVLLVIEIKSSDIYSYKEYCKKIVSILEKYKGNFVIKSFDIRIVNWFLRNTNYITGLLLHDLKKSFYDWVMNQRIIVSFLKPDFLSVNSSIVSNKMIQNYRKTKPILVWTIKNQEKLNKVKDYADSYLVEKFYF